jgi:hypothetical protein
MRENFSVKKPISPLIIQKAMISMVLFPRADSLCQSADGFIKMSSNWQLNMDIMSIIPSLVEALVDRLIVSSRSSQLSGGCNRKACLLCTVLEKVGGENVIVSYGPRQNGARQGRFRCVLVQGIGMET